MALLVKVNVEPAAMVGPDPLVYSLKLPEKMPVPEITAELPVETILPLVLEAVMVPLFVILPLIVKVWLLADSVPPLLTVKLVALAAAVNVTLLGEAIVTVSAAAGVAEVVT